MENTLDSAWGAFREGTDSVENDIQLSRDGQLFILHDSEMSRLYDREDVTAEDLTLEELRGIYAVWDHPTRGILVGNEVDAEHSRTGTFYGQAEKKQYAVPTLEEYIQAFKGTGLIHDTEIKSTNPAILPVYQALVDRYDAWDQFFSITFNAPILNAIYADYPSLSIGALGFLIQDGDQIVATFGDKVGTASAGDVEEGVQMLFSLLDTWNATANYSYDNAPREVVAAARHRGLTAWPWTYADPEAFATDYLFGVSGLTTDYAWWTENLLEEISSADLTIRAGEALPKPRGRNKRNEWQTLDQAEAVKVEDLPDGTALYLWRYKASLVLGGKSFGSYYLYSEPFTVKTETDQDQGAAGAEGEAGESPGAERSIPRTGDDAMPVLWIALIVLGALGIGACWLNKRK